MLSFFLTNLDYSSHSFHLTQETKTKSIYPISLTEVKRHLRIDNDFTDDDDYIEGLILAATEMAENYIGKDIAYTSTVVRIDDFNGDWIRINDGNFISIVSVLNSLDSAIGTIHQTSKHSDFFQIQWTETLESDPLKITYLSGYNVNETPALIKQAILIKIADLYDSARSDFNWNGMQDNKVFENILNFYKIILF
jgi:hypothetical protein